MMLGRGVEGRSTAFLIKLADHYRTAGRAFLAEDLLRQQVRAGRRDLAVRLAEHWVEFGDWRSARELLSPHSPDKAPIFGALAPSSP
jgi:hypothetical protein